MDLNQIIKQLGEDMRKSARGSFRPSEVVDLVLAAASTVRKEDECREMAVTEPYTTGKSCGHTPDGSGCHCFSGGKCCEHEPEKKEP